MYLDGINFPREAVFVHAFISSALNRKIINTITGCAFKSLYKSLPERELTSTTFLFILHACLINFKYNTMACSRKNAYFLSLTLSSRIIYTPYKNSKKKQITCCALKKSQAKRWEFHGSQLLRLFFL
jgi:hypothetical protein